MTSYAHVDEIGYSVLGAKGVVPLVLELLPEVNSVVDVGGGSGAWLREFINLGVKRATLIDSPAVKSNLLVDPQHLLPANLAEHVPDLSGHDLAVCLECAEHLPAQRARPLVQALCAVPMILWTAALPGQGGIGHINEQFPEYWRKLFAEQGYQPFDVIRWRILDNHSIPFWYRQNLVIYSRSENPRLRSLSSHVTLAQGFELVHDNVLNALRNPGTAESARLLGAAIARALFRRLPGKSVR